MADDPDANGAARRPSSATKLLAGRFQSDLLNLFGVGMEAFALIAAAHSGAAFTLWILANIGLGSVAVFALWLALRRARRSGPGLSRRVLGGLFGVEMTVLLVAFVAWLLLQFTGAEGASWAAPGFGLGLLLTGQVINMLVAGVRDAPGASRVETARSLGQVAFAAVIAASVLWGAKNAAAGAAAEAVLWPTALGALAWLLLETFGIWGALAGWNKPRIRGDGVAIGPPPLIVTGLSILKSGLQIVGMGFLAAYAFRSAHEEWLVATAIIVAGIGSLIGMVGGVVNYRAKYPAVQARIGTLDREMDSAREEPAPPRRHSDADLPASPRAERGRKRASSYS